MEQWRSVNGYEGIYEVSSLGRVYSLPRVIERGERIRQPVGGKMLALNEKTIRNNKYIIVNLYKNKKARCEYVHILVAQAFIPNLNNLREVNHKNLDKTDNRVFNLEWMSSQDNKRHAVNNGVLFNPNPKKGTEVTSSKLNNQKVRNIRNLATKGWTRKRLAAKFNVTKENIGYILLRKTWKHI